MHIIRGEREREREREREKEKKNCMQTQKHSTAQQKALASDSTSKIANKK
jgi:hypothetical protein